MPRPLFNININRKDNISMEHIYNLTDYKDDTAERFLGIDNVTNDQRLITQFDASSVYELNKEQRKSDGFSIDRSWRRVAHIDMNTVKLLAHNENDADAKAYLDYHDEAARDRMIRRYPHYFKACSGGI